MDVLDPSAAQAQPNQDELAASVKMRLNTFLKNIGRARKLLVACLRKQGITMEAR